MIRISPHGMGSNWSIANRNFKGSNFDFLWQLLHIILTMDSKDQLKRWEATILLNLGNKWEFSVPKAVVTQCNRSVKIYPSLEMYRLLLCILLKQNNVTALCIEVFIMGLSQERGNIGCFIVQLQSQECHCDPIPIFCQTPSTLCGNSARSHHVAKLRVQWVSILGSQPVVQKYLLDFQDPVHDS